MRSIIVADNQEITALGVKSLIEKIDIQYRVTEVKNKVELLSELMIDPQSMVILDYTLFDLSSLQELNMVCDRYPQSSWIFFTEDLSDTFFRDILTHDLPFSIIFKSTPLIDLEQAIKKTLRYEVYRDKQAESHITAVKKDKEQNSYQVLTSTEMEVLKQIALGQTTKEIATIRNLSMHTVVTHRKNIFKKLKVNNIYEATKYAMKAGIIDMMEYYI